MSLSPVIAMWSESEHQALMAWAETGSSDGGRTAMNIPTYAGPSIRRLRVWITQEPDDGGLTVEAADLPGCASHGETIEECLANIKDAFLGCYASYIAAGEKVPWDNHRERPLFSEERHIVVEVPQ